MRANSRPKIVVAASFLGLAALTGSTAAVAAASAPSAPRPFEGISHPYEGISHPYEGVQTLALGVTNEMPRPGQPGPQEH